MRLTSIRLPQNIAATTDYLRNLTRSLSDVLGKIDTRIALLSSGSIAGHDTAYTAAPTSGTWKQGDEVRNSAPSELGTAGSKYVIRGWICTASGTPGTWLQQRTLTGN